MIDKINRLKETFCKAKSDKERDVIDIQMKELIDQDSEKFAEAMLESAKETAERATQLAMKQKMKDIIPAVSWVYIAKNYFNKTDAWLYQRINGNIVNGKPAAFTPQEMETMRFALSDLSNKLGSLSASL
ncbi:MAG: DUF5053 domain-containing protein [Dysgonamonadaceae bacterium]|jgi:hypothetical protein|nr:DUF5053 domain-containing protein [Dysgonamonadaceae bacterium]